MIKTAFIKLWLVGVIISPAFSQTQWVKTTERLLVENPPFQQCHASTLVELDGGALMAAWFGGSHEGAQDVVIWTSVLAKGTWSTPIALADGVINDQLRYPTWNPVLFKEKSGTLFLFYKVGPNPREWWGMVKESRDNGKTWSAARRLPAGILGPIKNKPYQLTDGTILSPSSKESGKRWQAHIERSIDGGRTWQYIPIDTASELEVIQPSIIRFSDGRLQVLCRSKQGNVMQSSSRDNGKTWSSLTPTSLINPNAGTDAVTLRDGVQLIVYNPDVPGKDWWNGRAKLNVAVSRDGTNWSDIAVLENGDKEEFSYPSVIQTKDGKVHITYTYNRKNIKHVVLEEEKLLSLIPYPSSVTQQQGEFTISTSSTLASAAGFENEVSAMQQIFQSTLGKQLQKINGDRAQILLRRDDRIRDEEGYRLEVTSQQLVMSARTAVGMYRAIQTLRQLFPAPSGKSQLKQKQIVVPALSITDEPSFAWRGLHIDVARHFFSIGYLKKLLDRMAFYKLNKLHIHLTDDQGWRLEIKQYPLLTELGAWRAFDKNDSLCMKLSKTDPDMAIDPEHIIQRDGKTLYGGFYTQAEMKDLIRYATERHIDIIPEIDMPGHMMAAIHAYPELSCQGGSTWGELFSTPVCPCKESTFTFAENVFSEIIDLFPSTYIHLGADEVDRKPWMKSELCQELMKRENLQDAAALQSYFVKRMEKFFQSKGRKLVGWDEILEGGISPTAHVMYWRSWVPNAPVHAAKNGNKVIMSPGSPLYFDYPPDARSLSNIYQFNVIPSGLTQEEGQAIIGAQANLWSERVPSEKRADYLYFPRAVALAERVWSKSLNFSSFSQRLLSHYRHLDAFGVHYRLPDIEGTTQENVFVDRALFDVRKPLPELVLRYTVDGTIPNNTSSVLSKPLEITQPVTVKVAAFSASGLSGDVYTMNYRKQSLLPPELPQETVGGLTCKYYKRFFERTTLLQTAAIDSQFVVGNISVPVFDTAPSFALRYDGYIEVPASGIYSFYLLCDDGGVLTIGDREVVNNDGLHPAIEKSGQVALEKGMHKFRLDFIEGGGGYKLELKYSKDGALPAPIPSAWFRSGK